MWEKDRRRARERRLTTFSQGEWQIYRAFYCCNLYKAGIANGPVAQGIEQQPSKLKVAGSNPAGVANKIDSAGPPRGPSRRPAQDRRPFHRQ